MGTNRVRVLLESSNLVRRHIFYARKNGMVYFAVAPSKGVIHLVTEMRKWALTEPGRLQLSFVQSTSECAKHKAWSFLRASSRL